MQFSPFETDLNAYERDQTREQLERLEGRAPPAGPWKLAVIADSHSDYDELEELVTILNERDDLELVLHAGDLTDFGLRQEYRWTLERLRVLEVPFLTVIGNHDALSNGTQVYKGMFGTLDYAFDWGGVRFVCFNSNRLEFGNHVPRWEWAEEQAAPPLGGGVLLLTHIPPWAPEIAPPDRFQALLDRPGVLASLHGHLHLASARRVGAAPSIVVGETLVGSYAIVTIDGPNAQIELCRERDCTPVELD